MRLVGRASAGVPDRQPGGDPLAAHARLGRAVEHELDARPRRGIGGAQPADERRLRHARRPDARAPAAGSTRRRSVDRCRPAGRVSVGDRRPGSYAASDAAGAAATIERVSLLLLVDLDGVVYRGAEPVPGVAARPRRSGSPRRRRRLRHQQLDALPRRLRDAPVGDGLSGLARIASCRRRARPRSTSSGTNPGSGACWRSGRAGWSGSCATSGWTS